MKKLKVLILMVVLFAILAGCGAAEKEYLEDIVYPLKDGESYLIIKEWQYLLGSGEDIYYQQGDSSPVLLGKLSGADDGFCPFAEGLYEITEKENSVTFSWYFSSSVWRSETFELTK